MRIAVTPTAEERTFGAEEIIVSKTDLQGRITYANDVFVRVSGYPRAELAGRPHSLIRHPDMPRAIFRTLWQTVQGGQEIFAYVKNLAADGAFYWVLAHVTPSTDVHGAAVGYHSNRRLPAPAAVRAVEDVYRVLLDEERRHGTGNAAVDASSALLADLLARDGVTYDEWVWGVVNGHGGLR
ncbi:PAS domain-containing protein [Cellulomonas fimi]|uniref:PAS sensor protein n=1 Tax=Cellulomonas fimi (strain ATCC 484 / DSM 20113 / JCM 1341 / CCUG 24087 / LMG 16345 / NBRC 15513 / NCIMB 8980 / NCTC 7547 / NRS-133) TaxID=590998 RepID=F4GYA2_CELFA|nr:PAS domain-containing protein [Cellulomonas fimi]AEE45891.1 PAS sensor protein [Cellulomonas fimi ATCC 484]NNH06783.1 PAS domain-containing protein [Cellulomonas fimi]VEH30908.1 Aerotaxis receptor [Cellulomonas fimi]